MKRILLCLALISYPAMAELPSFPRLGFTQAKTEWLNGKPNILWLRWLDDKNNIQCYHFSLGQELGVLPVDWNDIEAIFLNASTQNLVNNSLTDAQKADCGTNKIPNSWLDQTANLPPAPVPTINWKVAVNGTFPDRPMDNPDFTTLKGQRAKVGDPCENEIIKTVSSKQSWHFTKSTTGVRGLAVCEMK